MHYLIHKFKENRGFTLIELLVSIAIIITAATAVVAILTATLRGSSKVNTLEDVRQNGSNALFQITKIVQYAEVFEGVSKTNDEEDYTNNCQVQAEDQQYSFLKVRYKGEIKEISCKSLHINDQSLINTARVKLTSASCSITCSQSSSVDPPIIGISFTLEQKNAQSQIGNSPEKSASLEFSTAIKMRNLNE